MFVLKIQVSASQEVCKKTKTPSLGYAETAEAVFQCGPTFLRSWSKAVKWVTYLFLCLIPENVKRLFIRSVSRFFNSIYKWKNIFIREMENWHCYGLMFLYFPPEHKRFLKHALSKYLSYYYGEQNEINRRDKNIVL